MAAEAPSLSSQPTAGEEVNIEMMPMPTWQRFYTMGNNCRVRQIPEKDAENIVAQWAVTQEDCDNFWEGFYNGRNDFVESVR